MSVDDNTTDVRHLGSVRRSVAAYQAGLTTIRACLLDPSGTLGPQFDVPLSQLLSRKVTLDLRGNPVWLIRFRRLQNALLRGVPVPPIVLVRGSHGTPIAQVKVMQ
jgi:hypothetical protein